MPRKRDERTSARNHDVYKLQRIISARGRGTQKKRKGKRDGEREEGDGAGDTYLYTGTFRTLRKL